MDGFERIIDTFFNIPIMLEALPIIIKVGLLNTLQLTVISGILSIFIGIIVAVGLMARSFVVRAPCRVFVDIFRGLPHILVVYVIGQGLPLAGLTVFGSSAFGYAVIAIAIMESAYMAEIFRSGFQGVNPGIIEASRSSGVSAFRTFMHIVVPIGTRQMLPALTGQFILIIKGTALVYVLGLMPSQMELFAIGEVYSINQANLSPLVASGLVYLAITIPLTYGVESWQKRTQ